MNEHELRVWLAKRLRVDYYPQELWELIPQDMREYAESAEEEREETLLPEAKRLLKACDVGEKGIHRESGRLLAEEATDEHESFQMEPNVYERERGAAYSEYLAKLATDDPVVRSFRKRNLGGEDGLLTQEEAEKTISEGGGAATASRQLSRGRAFPWTEEQAEWFLLTGGAPRIPPLTGRVNKRWGRSHNHGVITLEVEPWVSPGVVKDAYSRLQKRTVGGNNRRMKPKTLILFRFVMEQIESVHPLNLRERKERAERVGGRPQTDTALSGPSWREMMKRWNEQFAEDPNWHYRDEQNFARDFRNAERRIANPVKG